MTERYQAHKLIDRLYQGGFPPPGSALRRAGIDVLVLCAMEHQDARLYPGLQVILAGGDDSFYVPRMMQFIPTWERAAARQPSSTSEVRLSWSPACRGGTARAWSMLTCSDN